MARTSTINQFGYVCHNQKSATVSHNSLIVHFGGCGLLERPRPPQFFAHRMKFPSLLVTGISLAYSLASIILLLATASRWSDSMTGTIGKSVSTLYYFILLSLTCVGMYGIVKEKTRIMSYYTRFLGMFILVSLAQMTISTLALLNGRDKAINQCFQWAAFNPQHSPRRPDCANAVTVTVWVAFAIYLLSALIHFAGYKIVNHYKNSLEMPVFVIDGTLEDGKLDTKIRSPSICSQSPMMEGYAKPDPVELIEDKDDTIVNGELVESERPMSPPNARLSMAMDRRTSRVGVVQDRRQSTVVNENRLSVHPETRRLSQVSLFSEHTLIPQTAPEPESIYTPVVVDSVEATQPVAESVAPIFQVMAPTLERSVDQYQAIDLGPDPFPVPLNQQAILFRNETDGSLTRFNTIDKRRSALPLRLSPPVVRERRPSDSHLYHPPTIDRRPAQPPAFLQHDPIPKSPIAIPQRKSSREDFELQQELDQIEDKLSDIVSNRRSSGVSSRRPSQGSIYDRRPSNASVSLSTRRPSNVGMEEKRMSRASSRRPSIPTTPKE
jgi:hypothetical protein